MPPRKNQQAAAGEHGAQARRAIGRPVKRHPVPSGESTAEAGPPRLYRGESTGSTSTQESGPRRLYTSRSADQ